MARWLKTLLATVLMLLIPMSALAGPAEIGPLPDKRAAELGPAITTPHDMQVANDPIPPLPPSYVTKNLGWLELSYPPQAAERVAPILAEADSIRAELTAVLGQPVLQHVVVRIAPSTSDMARLAPADAPPPEYASGVAYNGLHFVLISMLAPRGGEAVDVDETFRHELAHVALEDAVGGRHVPVWFNEGFAIYLSNELPMARTKTLWSATLSGTLIPLSDLDRSFPRDNFAVSIAYAESADFMQFLTRKSDRLRFSALVDRVREGQPFERAVNEAYSADLKRLEFEWRGNLEHRFSVIPILTGGGLVWMLVIGALVAAYVRRRRRTKAILARWEREEAIEDARIAAKLAAEKEELATALIPVPASIVKPVSIKIEQNGRWHTLH